MDAFSRRAALLSALLGLIALVALPSCKPEVPSNWYEMGFPLGAGELRAGEEHSEKKIVIDHGGIADTSGTCGNYSDELISNDFERTTDSSDQNTDEQIVRNFVKGDKQLQLICRNAVNKTVVTLKYVSKE